MRERTSKRVERFKHGKWNKTEEKMRKKKQEICDEYKILFFFSSF